MRDHGDRQNCCFLDPESGVLRRNQLRDAYSGMLFWAGCHKPAISSAATRKAVVALLQKSAGLSFEGYPAIYRLLSRLLIPSLAYLRNQLIRGHAFFLIKVALILALRFQ